MPEGRAVWLDRDVIEAHGEEAASFLQGQVSQDVLALADGQSAWSWVLSPQGKVDALARVTRLSGDRWLLDTDAGWGEAVVQRLNRFRLRTKVTVEARDWRVLGLRGDGPAGDPDDPDEVVTRADPVWPGVEGVDLIGAHPRVPDGREVIGPAGYEAERIGLAIPKMGAELDDRTIPGETGLIARTVSFTKGCYTGQELVARVDSRGGNVPRRLARLSPGGPAEAGESLETVEGQSAGMLTSVAEEPGGGWVALGYLKRGVDTGAQLRTEGGVTVAIEGLVG